jgi:hypothetical protein
MSKVGLHDPFRHFKHKLWPKEGSGVNLTIWLSTTKSRESSWLPCVQVVCNMLLESSRWRLQISLELISIEGLHTKICAPKVVGVSILGILRLPFGSPGTKCHLDAGPVASHRVYYKGEGGGFSQVWAMVSFVNLNLPVAHPNTKSAATMH